MSPSPAETVVFSTSQRKARIRRYLRKARPAPMAQRRMKYPQKGATAHCFGH